MGKLDDPTLRGQFRQRYTNGRRVFPEGKYEPEIAEARRQFALRDAIAYDAEFDQMYEEAKRLWRDMESSPLLKGFRTVRDKVTAHTEIKRHNEEYKPVDIGTLGIKWGDLKKTIDSMQQLVELIGRLTRDAGFAWEHLDRLLEAAGSDFWQDRAFPIPSEH